MEQLDINLKPIKGLDEWVKKQYETHYIWYHRKGYYAECACSECGKMYILRTEPTKDVFVDDFIGVEKPVRDKETKCRLCGTKALYKPVGHTKNEFRYHYFVTGQKITDEKFVFRIHDTYQRIKAGCQTGYSCRDYKLIVCEKGKKPVRYDWNHLYGWVKGSTGESFRYTAHPSLFREIKKTKMYKYIPVPNSIKDQYVDDSWIIDFYIAAARYPDFEMLVKLGLDDYWQRLVKKLPTNINPRGKTIEDRLRVNKDRLKDIIDAKGQHQTLELYQAERRLGAHWTDEELEIIKELKDYTYNYEWEKLIKAIKYTSPVRLRNYMKKQKMWMPNHNAEWRERTRRSDLRREYYDYLIMREEGGYDMTNDIILYPADFRRRRDEMLLQTEKKRMDKWKAEALDKYPKIKTKYRRLSDKYSAAAGGYIIRPAKDAAEIIEEGRILHHCVGGCNYLSRHNDGRSFILFLRKTSSKDMPYITVEIRDETIIQWYGAYDKKPNKKLIDAWLKTYTQELEKRKTKPKKASCTGTTKERRTA